MMPLHSPEFFLGVSSSSGAEASETQSIKVLVDPVIAPGQFRKATAVRRSTFQVTSIAAI